ncbi:hypothetical protein CRENBAI_009560, partial [Crenichthys baileyi]
ICLQPGTIGGFESDSIPFDDSVDGNYNRHRAREDAPITVFHNGWLEMDLSPLADLPQSSRCDLIEKLQEALRDRPTLSYLQIVLERVCDCEAVQIPIMGEKEAIPRNSTTVDLMESCRVSEGPSDVSSHLNSAYLLVSAMEELPDDTLNILSNSQPDFLAAFDVLLQEFFTAYRSNKNPHYDRRNQPTGPSGREREFKRGKVLVKIHHTIEAERQRALGEIVPSMRRPPAPSSGRLSTEAGGGFPAHGLAPDQPSPLPPTPNPVPGPVPEGFMDEPPPHPDSCS